MSDVPSASSASARWRPTYGLRFRTRARIESPPSFAPQAPRLRSAGADCPTASLSTLWTAKPAPRLSVKFGPPWNGLRLTKGSDGRRLGSLLRLLRTRKPLQLRELKLQIL